MPARWSEGDMGESAEVVNSQLKNEPVKEVQLETDKDYINEAERLITEKKYKEASLMALKALARDTLSNESAAHLNQQLIVCLQSLKSKEDCEEVIALIPLAQSPAFYSKLLAIRNLNSDVKIIGLLLDRISNLTKALYSSTNILETRRILIALTYSIVNSHHAFNIQPRLSVLSDKEITALGQALIESYSQALASSDKKVAKIYKEKIDCITLEIARRFSGEKLPSNCKEFLSNNTKLANRVALQLFEMDLHSTEDKARNAIRVLQNKEHFDFHDRRFKQKFLNIFHHDILKKDCEDSLIVELLTAASTVYSEQQLTPVLCNILNEDFSTQDTLLNWLQKEENSHFLMHLFIHGNLRDNHLKPRLLEILNEEHYPNLITLSLGLSFVAIANNFNLEKVEPHEVISLYKEGLDIGSIGDQHSTYIKGLEVIIENLVSRISSNVSINKEIENVHSYLDGLDYLNQWYMYSTLFLKLAAEPSKQLALILFLQNTHLASSREEIKANKLHQFLLDATLQLLNDDRLKIAEVSPLLEEYNSLELFALLKKSSNIDSEITHLEVLLSKVKTLPSETIKDFLLSDNEVPQHFISRLLSYLNDDNLTQLITQLYHNKESSAFNELLYIKALEQLCTRLTETANNHEHPLHKLVDSKFLNSGIGFDLLSSPGSFEKLCSLKNYGISYSADFIWTYSSYDTKKERELENRIIKLLRCKHYEKSEIDEIGLNLLIKFKECSTLYTLFCNLYAASEKLTFKDGNEASKNGEDNYLALKKAIFAYLSPNDTYDDKIFWDLLYKLSSNKKTKDRVNTKIATQVTRSENPSLGAKYLSSIEDIEGIEVENWNWDDESLIGLLIHSGSEMYSANWKLAYRYLNASYETIVAKKPFIVSIIDAVSDEKLNHFNKDSIQKSTAELILSFDDFNSLLPELNLSQLQFLAKHIPLRDSQQKLVIQSWLEQLKENDRLSAKVSSSLLQTVSASLAPQENYELLTHIYSESLFTTSKELTDIFNAISPDISNYSQHYVSLLQVIRTKDNSFKQAFLNGILDKKHSPEKDPFILPLITQLLFEIEDLSPREHSHNQLVEKVFRLLNNHYSSAAKNENKLSLREIEQRSSNVLQFLCSKDSTWPQTLCNQPQFIQYLDSYLHGSEERNRNSPLENPVFKLFTEYGMAGCTLPEELRKKIAYTEFVSSILCSDSVSITSDEFYNFYDSLTSKQESALKLLNRDIFSEVNNQAILTSSQTLNTEQLFNAFTKSKNKQNFVDIFFLHPHAAFELSSEQLNAVITHVENERQILSILNGQTNRQNKQLFVDTLFKHINQSSSSIKEWIDKHLQSKESYAILFNYITEESAYYEEVCHLIEQNEEYSKSLYKSMLHSYFRQPTLDFFIQPDSLLYTYLNASFLSPKEAINCDAKLFHFLSSTDAEYCLRRQFSHATMIDSFVDLFSPFGQPENTEIKNKLLASACWLNRIPLLAALFKVKKDYDQGEPSLRLFFENSTLYKKFTGFFSNENHPISIELYNELYQALKAYINHLNEQKDLLENESIKQALNQQIDSVELDIRRFESRLEIMKEYSPIEMFYLFNPETDFSKLKKRQSSYDVILPESKLKAMAESSEKQQHYTRYQYGSRNNPEWYIASFLGELPELEQDTVGFICQEMLTNQKVRAQTSEKTLNKLFGRLSSENALLLIQKNQEKLKLLSSCLTFLNSQFLQCESLNEIIEALAKNLDLKGIYRLMSQASQANAHQLVNLCQLTISAIENNISKEQLFKTFLPAENFHFTGQAYHRELEWLKKDIEKMSNHQYQLQNYTNTLLEKSFSFKSRFNQSSLHALIKLSSLDNIDSSSLAKVFNSYAAYYANGKNAVNFQTYIHAFFKLTDSLEFHAQEDFIKRIDQTLLEEIIKSSLTALNNENTSTSAIRTINLLIDITLRESGNNTELLAFIKENLDQHKAFHFDSALKAMKSETLNAELSSLDQHTFNGLWIQRLLMNPKGFSNLLPTEVQALIERYRMSSRILKKDELDHWIKGNKELLQELYHKIKLYDARISSANKGSDISGILTDREEALQKIERIERKQRQILYFKADDCIQEMFKQLQQTIDEFKQYSIGKLDSLPPGFNSMSQSQAREIAEHAERLLSQFQAQELTNAKTSVYSSFMDAIYKKFLENKGDLETEFSPFWHYVSRFTKQNSAVTHDLLSKNELSEGQFVYDSQGEKLGKVNADKRIELLNSPSLLIQHHSSQVGMPLFDEKKNQIGSLNLDGSVCAQNNFTGEATANIIRYVSLEKLKKIPVFETIVKDVIAEGQLSGVLDSIGYLSFLYNDVSTGDEKSSWVKSQILTTIIKQKPALSSHDCDSLCSNYALKEIYQILDEYPPSQTVFNLHESLQLNVDLKKAILSDEKTKRCYFDRVKQAKLSHTQLERLYTLQITPEIKQLTLVHLLNNESYVKTQGTTSLIKKTKDDSVVKGSRLLLTAACVDLSLLAVDIIEQLDEEPAAELLLSLKTYQTASQEQFNCLFTKIKDQKSLVKYFLVNNQSLPLFEQGFLKFYTQNPTLIWEAAALLDGDRKSLLLRRILKDTGIMSAIVKNLTDNKEVDNGLLASIFGALNGKATSINDLFTKDDIIYAISLYIDGYNSSPEYLAFLSSLVNEKLTRIIELDEQDDKSVSLSEEDLEVIFKLNEDETFKGIHKEYLLTSYHLDKLLNQAALFNNTSLFYRKTHLDIDNATRPINQNLLTNTKVNGVISRVADKVVNFFSDLDWQEVYENAKDKGNRLLKMRWDKLPEDYQWSQLESFTYDDIKNQSMDFFQQVCGSVKAIDLYLFNCLSANNQVKKLISDYLDYYQNNLSQVTKLRSTVYLINNRHVSDEIKQAIYEALESRAELFLQDGVICDELFLYKQTDLIEKYGKLGQYDEVISLCSTLEITHPNNDVISQAKQEAELEKKISKMNWFVGIRKWWNRMRTYGWSGFFKPNSPTHVITSGQAQLIEPSEIHHSYNKAQEALPPREPTTLEILESYSSSCQGEDLVKIIETMKNFHNSLATSPEEECLIRESIERISNDLKSRCTNDFSNSINQKVLNNSFLFMENRSKLISLYCDKGEPANIRLNALLNKMDEEQAKFQKLFTPEALRVLEQVIASFRPNLNLSSEKEVSQQDSHGLLSQSNTTQPCAVEARHVEKQINSFHHNDFESSIAAVL